MFSPRGENELWDKNYRWRHWLTFIRRYRFINLQIIYYMILMDSSTSNKLFKLKIVVFWHFTKKIGYSIKWFWSKKNFFTKNQNTILFVWFLCTKLIYSGPLNSLKSQKHRKSIACILIHFLCEIDQEKNSLKIWSGPIEVNESIQII